MLTRPIPKSARVGMWGLLTIVAVAAVLLPMAKAGQSPANGPEVSEACKTVLADGVTVELIGLGTAPWEADQQWWRPDGCKIDRPEFKKVGDQPLMRWPANPGGLQFRCAALLKFSNYSTKGVSVPCVRSADTLLHAGLVSGIADDGTQLTYIVSAPGPHAVPESADMSVAVATGPFKKAETPSEAFREKSHKFYTLEGGLTVIRHPLHMGIMDTLTVDLTCPRGDIEYRVTAKLKNGQSEVWAGGSFGERVKFFQATPRRENIKPQDIETLVIEYRPYQWVTFENISLRPGVETEPHVRTFAESSDLHSHGDEDAQVAGARSVTDGKRDSLPNIFVMGSSQGAGDIFGAVVARAGEWTWNKTGRHHTKKSYDEVFNGTHNRTDHDVLVLIFALDQEDRIPREHEGLLPQPWPQIAEQLKQGRVVEFSGRAQGLHVILLAAPKAEQLLEVIARSRLLGDPQALLGRKGEGSDVAIEDFKVMPEPDRGTFWAAVSIRNVGTAPSSS